MAIVRESLTSTDSSDADPSFNMPATRPDGDLYLMFGGHDDAVLLDVSGWTEHEETGQSGTLRGAIYSRVGSSEPASYTFDNSGSADQSSMHVMRISGQDGTSPINASNIASGTSSTPTAPSVTTTVDNCLILRCFLSDGADFNSLPDTIWLDRHVFAIETAVTYEEQASAGSTGTAAAGLVASDEWIAITIAIAPAAGGANEASGAPEAEDTIGDGVAGLIGASSGTAASEAALVTGTAQHVSEASGAAAASVAAASGEADAIASASGEVGAAAASSSGAADAIGVASGAPQAEVAVAVGAAEVEAEASGSPQAGAAEASGDATVGDARNSSGSGQAANALASGIAQTLLVAEGDVAAVSTSGAGSVQHVSESSGAGEAGVGSVEGVAQGVPTADGDVEASTVAASGTAESEVEAEGTPQSEGVSASGSAQVISIASGQAQAAVAKGKGFAGELEPPSGGGGGWKWRRRFWSLRPWIVDEDEAA